MPALKSAAELQTLRLNLADAMKNETCRVAICAGLGCVAKGSLDVYRAFQAELQKRGLLGGIDVFLRGEEGRGVNTVSTGCNGLCEAGPLVYIDKADVLYAKVGVEHVAQIIDRTILHGELVEDVLPRNDAGELCRHLREVPFYAKQKKIVLEKCGAIDPTDIRDYITHNGYAALAACLADRTPQEVVDTMLASGLRGRGGGGFPTGRKWQLAAKEENPVKYVIINADEGDPGAFMDRSVLEGDPHSVIEGAAIAGYAIGAHEGYVYVRAEYPLAVQRLKAAIAQAEEYNLLGDSILGSAFSFHLKIKEGAGAFVCGEETALMASIEGDRGMPKPKPPFPAQSGLWGKPTIINNVETMAAVPAVIEKGAEWFKQFGTSGSSGTKTFALSGKLRNTGLVEVPFGVTLRELVFDIGGGIQGDGRFKAAQIGGPSGGCLTEEHLDMPLDYDSLQKAGAIVGSGGLVILDDKTCMVETARYFMNFTQNESCGKCVPCREGTNRMLEIMERIVRGQGEMADLDMLQEIAAVVKDGSLCGLGKTAPNPVLSTLKYFRDEYLAHIVEKRCPAGDCKYLQKYEISTELCRGCGICARKCPSKAISGEPKKPYVIDSAACTKCGLCVTVCPFKAVALA